MSHNIMTPFGLKEVEGVKLADMQLPIWQRRQIKPTYTRNGYGAMDEHVLNQLIAQEKTSSYLVDLNNCAAFGFTEEQYFVAIGSEKTCTNCDELHEVDRHVVAQLKKLDENSNPVYNENGQQIYEDRQILPPGRHRYNKAWKTVQYTRPAITVEEVVIRQPKAHHQHAVEKVLVSYPASEMKLVLEPTTLKVVGHVQLEQPKAVQPMKRPRFK